jgi:DNA-binding XRE family transcriptional regulator
MDAWRGKNTSILQLARLEAGFLLRLLQRGEKIVMPHSRPMPSIGRRCHEQGWKVGTAADFLDLSAEESAYVEMKLALSKKLKERRARKKLTQAELAKAIESSQSRVAKMEAGDPTVSIDLLVKSLLALGVSKKELGRTIS